MFNEIAFRKQSNKAAFIVGPFGVVYAADKTPFDWTGWTATVRIVRADNLDCEVARATSTNPDEVLLQPGSFQATFPANIMRGICSGQYKVGLILSNGDEADTVQLFIGSLPTIEGI